MQPPHRLQLWTAWGISAGAFPPCWGKWTGATAAAQPVLLLPMLSRAEGRGAGTQLRPTLMGSWAQLELEAKKSSGSHH